MEPIITASRLTKRFRKLLAVDELDLRMEPVKPGLDSLRLSVQMGADMPSPSAKSGSADRIKVTLKFSDYRVNKGISDTIFESKPRSGRGNRR